MKKIFTLIYCLSFISFSQAQVLVSAEPIGVETIEDNLSPIAGFDLDLFKLTYNTLNPEGEMSIATGMMLIPADAEGSCLPMLVAHHGTVNDRETVPSRRSGGYELGAVYCGSGMIGVMPDLIGLGDSPGTHTYIHAESAASASLDMMRAVREYVEEQSNVHFNDQVFITGYSQGGHTAMANFKDLEENHSDEWTVVAAAPMSGPYDVSKTMIDFTLGDEEYGFSSYLVAVTLAMKRAYPELLVDFEIEDIFREPYQEAVNLYNEEAIGLFDLLNMLEATLLEEQGRIVPRFMMKEEALESIMSPDGFLNEVLRLQNLFDWAPQAPMRMFYCTQDEQVAFGNALVAEARMHELGSVDNVQAVNKGDFNHNGCIEPAVTECLIWFTGLIDLSNTCITSTFDLWQTKAPLIQGTNVVNGQVDTFIDDREELANPILSIFSLQGTAITNIVNPSQYSSLDVSGMTSGMYLLSLREGNTVLKTEKFIIY